MTADTLTRPAGLTDKDKALLRTKSYINGEWIGADDGKTYTVTNPATGEAIAEVADCGGDETTRAVEAAHAALPAWRAKLAKERCNILRRWYDLIMANQEALARLMTAEQGKPLAESRGEIAYGASFIEFFAEEAKRIHGEIIPAHKPGAAIHVTRQPVGVVGAVTPWNFPNAMITRKAAPALAAGCTIVIKPAQDTPFSALALAELAEQAGIPKGVFNIVTGDDPKEIGDVLTGHKDVAKFTFTGSTGVGKMLAAQCATTVKKVSLELGGNAPFIVFDDADIDAAVEGAMASKYRNAGQTCVCANRIYVQSGVLEEFTTKFTAAVAALKVGDGLEDEEATQGPLINMAAVEKVEELIADAVDKGGRVTIGGQRHSKGHSFFEPTIITGATQDMAFAQDEIFGPVAPIYSFETEEEAISRANDTIYGLAAYFYARDIGRIERVADALDYGIVGINEGIISTELAPFGGMKQSGLGREGSHLGMDDFVEIKYRCLGGL
ncbi:MAG: NAD-dependent succinate-semialdehyde dehydrogenase [Alphaproteobacteria bacterium]